MHIRATKIKKGGKKEESEEEPHQRKDEDKPRPFEDQDHMQKPCLSNLWLFTYLMNCPSASWQPDGSDLELAVNQVWLMW